MPKKTLRGIDSAPEFFVDGIDAVHFHGAMSRYVFYRDVLAIDGGMTRKAVLTLVGPTGSLSAALRLLVAFAIEHRLPVPLQDDTR